MILFQKRQPRGKAKTIPTPIGVKLTVESFREIENLAAIDGTSRHAQLVTAIDFYLKSRQQKAAS